MKSFLNTYRFLIFIGLILLGSVSVYSQDAEMENSEESTVSTQPDTLDIIDVHPQDSPENKGFLITSKDGLSSLRIRGSIRLSGGFDLNGLQSKNTFATYDIPVGIENNDAVRYFMSVNQTRLGLEANKHTFVGDVSMRIETDFMGANSTPRLRHVYGATDNWLVGQTWSVFGDVSSLPNTVDLDGPNSAVAERTVQIRYSNTMKNNIQWSVAIESPSPDIIYSDSLSYQQSFQSFPDFSTRFRKRLDNGHIQFSAILRSISGKDSLFQPYYMAGYGGLISGNLAINEKSRALFQAYYGAAISRFVTGLTNRGLDAIYNPETDRFEPLASAGGFVSYNRQWKPMLYSFFTAGVIKIFNTSYQADTDMSFTYYFSGNLFWDTQMGTRAGVEYSWGRRTNKDWQHGDASRISFIFYYDF